MTTEHAPTQWPFSRRCLLAGYVCPQFGLGVVDEVTADVDGHLVDARSASPTDVSWRTQGNQVAHLSEPIDLMLVAVHP